MLAICAKCDKVIENLDKVEFKATSTYHLLKSTVAYALDKNSLEVIGPLSHSDCLHPRGEYSE